MKTQISSAALAATAVAVLVASPAIAGYCGPMHAASSALGASRARTAAACDTDSKIAGEPCNQAMISEGKAIAVLDKAIARCKVELDRATLANDQSKPPVTWSYDPPPAWRPE